MVSSGAEPNVDWTHYEGSASTEIALRRSYEIPERSLSASKYFSKAVQQLSSPDKMSTSLPSHRAIYQGGRKTLPAKASNEGVPVTFSTQQGSHRNSALRINLVERSRTEHGALELSVTPRLKKSMSNVPFRPPFKPFA